MRPCSDLADLDCCRYNAGDHPIPFYRNTAGKPAKKMGGGGPAPDFEDAFVDEDDDVGVSDDGEDDSDDVTKDKLIKNKAKKAKAAPKAAKAKATKAK